MNSNNPSENTRLKNFEEMLSLEWLIKKTFSLWWLFLLVGFLFGLMGFFYAKLTPVKYKSRLTFALDDGKGSSSGIISLASELGFNLNTGVSIFSGDNIIDITKSRKIVEKALTSVDTINGSPVTLIEQYLTVTNYYSGKNPGKKLRFPPGQEQKDYSYQQDSLLKSVYQQFNSSLISAQRPDKRLSIYEINVTTPDERLTKVLTDRLVSEANQFYFKIKTEKTKKTLDILETRVLAMKGNLSQSLSERATTQDKNLNPAFSQADVPVLRQQSNIQVYGAAYAELFKNLELARFQYLNEMPVMQVIDEASYPMEKIRKGKLITAALFAIGACLLLFFGLWLKRVIANLKSNSEISR